MSNSILSQEEIDAIMNAKPEPAFSSIELDALGEISNISMGSAATALSALINKKVEISAPQVEISRIEALEKDLVEKGLTPSFFAQVDFKAGFSGSTVLMLNQADGGIIVDLLMGGDGLNPPRDFNEIHVSAIAEVMNQMMGSSATSISAMLSKMVDISPPRVFLDEEHGLEKTFSDVREQVVKVSFQLKVEGLMESSLLQVIPFSIAREMVSSQLGEVRKSFVGSDEPVVRTDSLKSSPGIGSPAANPASPSLSPGSNGNQVQVRPVQFSSFQPVNTKAEPNNLGLILDVPVVVSVELGKTKKTIGEILDFSAGSIIELDRLAGETVDIIANGKLLAKGEVVVINENFGVRITEIQNSVEKIKSISN